MRWLILSKTSDPQRARKLVDPLRTSTSQRSEQSRHQFGQLPDPAVNRPAVNSLSRLRFPVEPAEAGAIRNWRILTAASSSAIATA